MKKRSASTAVSTSSSISNCSSESSSVESDLKRLKSTIKKPKAKKTEAAPPVRSSVFRGVTRHRWTGRFEAHLWDKETWNTVQTKKGRQVYLGAYDNEEVAAKTYDLAAIKYWGPDTALNFPIEVYHKEMDEMHKLTREEYLATLRRRSSGFSRGVSKFRGVAKHHHNGRWEARIGSVLGNKYLYLGTYSTQEEAAAAYDRAAIQYRGPNAVTNFDISNYTKLLTKKDPLDDEDDKEIEIGEQLVDEQPQQLNPKIETYVQGQENNIELDIIDNQTKHDTKLDRYSNAQDLSTMEHMLDEDHGMINKHELSWDLNMDAHFNELPVPNLSDITKSCELPTLIDDYISFEDNLDFMFCAGLEYDFLDMRATTILPSKTSSSSSSSHAHLPTIIWYEE